MITHARVVTVDDLAEAATLVVPVVFDDTGALVADAVPSSLGGHDVPRVLDAATCERLGLSASPGSLAVLAALHGPHLAFVSLGATYNDPEAYRLAGAAVAHHTRGDVVGVALPTDAIERPFEAAQAFVEGAILASYSYKSRDADRRLDVVALGAPLPSVADHDDVDGGDPLEDLVGPDGVEGGEPVEQREGDGGAGGHVGLLSVVAGGVANRRR